MEINTIMAIVSAMLAISEGLSLIPRFKSNGVFQIVVNVLKWLTTKPKKKKEEKDEL
jgi:hypothetical protein